MKLPGPLMTMVLVALIAALAAPFMASDPFDDLLFGLPPVLAVVLAAGFGVASLMRLQMVHWAMPGNPTARAVLTMAGLGAALALPMVALDAALPFAADINVPLPDAVGFYLAMGFIAEVMLILVPLALISQVLPAAFWPAAAIAAVAEPAYQIWAGGSFEARDAIMALILIGVSIAQIVALKRHGFGGAIAVRLGYYLVWHILWGAARTGLLFAS